MEIKEVKYRGETYVVHGDFDPETGKPAPSFWITKVFLSDSGIEVTEEMTAENFADLQTLILKEYED